MTCVRVIRVSVKISALLEAVCEVSENDKFVFDGVDFVYGIE